MLTVDRAAQRPITSSLVHKKLHTCVQENKRTKDKMNKTRDSLFSLVDQLIGYQITKIVMNTISLLKRDFDVLLTVLLSVILVTDQLNAQILVLN